MAAGIPIIGGLINTATRHPYASTFIITEGVKEFVDDYLDEDSLVRMGVDKTVAAANAFAGKQVAKMMGPLVGMMDKLFGKLFGDEHMFGKMFADMLPEGSLTMVERAKMRGTTPNEEYTAKAMQKFADFTSGDVNSEKYKKYDQNAKDQGFSGIGEASWAARLGFENSEQLHFVQAKLTEMEARGELKNNHVDEFIQAKINSSNLADANAVARDMGYKNERERNAEAPKVEVSQVSHAKGMQIPRAQGRYASSPAAGAAQTTLGPAALKSADKTASVHDQANPTKIPLEVKPAVTVAYSPEQRKMSDGGAIYTTKVKNMTPDGVIHESVGQERKDKLGNVTGTRITTDGKNLESPTGTLKRHSLGEDIARGFKAIVPHGRGRADPAQYSALVQQGNSVGTIGVPVSGKQAKNSAAYRSLPNGVPDQKAPAAQAKMPAPASDAPKVKVAAAASGGGFAGRSMSIGSP